MVNKKKARVDSNPASRQKGKDPISPDVTMTEDDDEATVAADNVSPLLCTRITLVLKVPASNDPRGTTRRLLQNYLTQCQQSDRTAAYLPWYTDNSSPPIARPQDVSADFQTLQSYFPRLNPKKDLTAQTQYVSVFLRHTDDLIDLQKDMQFWFSDGGHKLYEKPLQCEKTVEVAWLQYSTREMDKDLISREIMETLGIEVGMSWKMIYMGKKGDIAEKNKIRALHIEINAIRQHHHFKLLSDHYGRSETGFSGRKLRLFPVKNKTKSDHSHKKLMKAILRQQSFLALVQSDTNSDILTLDTKEGDLDTLRVLICQLLSTKYPSLPLFLSVDKHFWSSAGYHFQFMPHMEEEATMMMHNLIPVLAYHHGDKVKKYFYPEAVAAAKEDYWDDKLKRVVCNSDLNMDAEDEEDSIGLSMALEFTKQAAIDLNTPPPKATARPTPQASQLIDHAYYQDDDSISTLHTTGEGGSSCLTPSATYTPRSVTTLPSMDSTEIVSVTSGITQESLHAVSTDISDKGLSQADHETPLPPSG